MTAETAGTTVASSEWHDGRDGRNDSGEWRERANPRGFEVVTRYSLLATEVAIVAVFAVVAAVPAWAGTGSPPTVTCPRMATPPAIDGKIGTNEWADAAALSPFVLLGGKGMPSLTTEAFVAYDDKALYVGAKLFDPTPGEIRCATTERDGPVYRDDCLEVLLDPDNQGEHYIHLAVNAAGAVFDAVDEAAGQDLDWVAKTSKWQSGWSVEMAFDFGEGTYPAQGRIWGLTVCRNAPRIAERSSWCALSASCAEPADFGSMTFAGPPLRCELGPVEEPWFGDNYADLTVTNLSDANQTVKVNVRVTGPTRRAHYFGVEKLELKAGEKRGVKMGFKVFRGGPGDVRVSAQVIEGEKALAAFRSAPMPFELPVFGALLDEALSHIAACYQTYVLLRPEDRPLGSEVQLDGLFARWRYLDGEYQRRADLSVDMIDALGNRAKALKEDAATVSAQLAACSTP